MSQYHLIPCGFVSKVLITSSSGTMIFSVCRAGALGGVAKPIGATPTFWRSQPVNLMKLNTSCHIQ